MQNVGGAKGKAGTGRRKNTENFRILFELPIGMEFLPPLCRETVPYYRERYDNACDYFDGRYSGEELLNAEIFREPDGRLFEIRPAPQISALIGATCFVAVYCTLAEAVTRIEDVRQGGLHEN